MIWYEGLTAFHPQESIGGGATLSRHRWVEDGVAQTTPVTTANWVWGRYRANNLTGNVYSRSMVSSRKLINIRQRNNGLKIRQRYNGLKIRQRNDGLNIT